MCRDVMKKNEAWKEVAEITGASGEYVASTASALY